MFVIEGIVTCTISWLLRTITHKQLNHSTTKPLNNHLTPCSSCPCKW